ncbi:MAG: transporter substrate-binding domain-containing diguanylate cyclase [Campylobacterota bacterium]
MAIDFSKKERTFIKQNPVISISMMPNFPPFTYKKNGVGIGFEHDVLELLSKNTGLEFKKNYGIWSKSLNRFKTGQTDMISSISLKEERKAFTIYTQPYYTIPIMIFVRDDFGSYTGLESLKGKKVGIIKDIFYDKELREKGYMNLVEYDTYQELTDALVFGKIDALIQNLTNINFLIKKNAYTNIRIASELELPGIKEEDLRFGVNPNKEVLRSIIQKGLEDIKQPKWDELIKKWLDVRRNNNKEHKVLSLTPKQQRYLQEKKSIDICIDPNWMPFEHFDKDGRYEGMSADFFKLFEKKLPVNFNIVKTNSWTQSLEYVKQGECNLLSLAMPTPKRKKYLSFTTSYLSAPIVMATKSNVAFVGELDDLKDKKLAISKGYAFAEILQDRYPNLDIIEVENIDSGLDKVRDEKVFGYIGTLATIGYKFQTKYMGELKITGNIKDKLQLAVAVKKDNSILHEIMQKAVMSISDTQKRAILNKWISIKYEKRTDYTLLWQVVAFFSAILLVGGYFYTKLYRLKKQLQEAYTEMQHQAITDKLTGIYNRHKLDKTLDNEIQKSKRYGASFGVLILDIDLFKKVNDSYGHHIGDKILQEFTKVLNENCRKTDLLGRWGGEEFLIIVPHTSKDKLLSFAQKIRAAVNKHSFNEVGRVTTSIGCAVYNKNDTNESLVKRADDALYVSKNSGRDKVMFY